MSDLIDRQAAIDFIDAGHLVNPNEPRWSDNEVVNFLKSRPSAQPEPCEDAVSRKAAIKCCAFGRTSLGLIDELRRLPSVTPKQRWIPCSERLPDHPENNDYYLVTIQCEHYDGWDDYVTGFAEWTENGWDELSCYIGQIKVVAWMPLPEPYTERREG